MATGYNQHVCIPVEAKEQSAPPPYSSQVLHTLPANHQNLPAIHQNLPTIHQNLPAIHQNLPAALQPPQPAFHYHQQQQQSTPFQQPQLVVLAQPHRQTKPEVMKRRRRVSIICGVVELAHAIAMLILGMALARQVEPGLASQAFFVPVLTFVTAVLSIIAGVRGFRGCLIATLVMAIITSIVSGACFILSAVMCGIYADRPAWQHVYYNGEFVAYRTLSIMFGVALTIHLVVVVTCIVQSSYACAELCRCCRSGEDPMSGAKLAYIAQPDQNGQLVFGGQAMPVIDMGRQNIPPPVIIANPGMVGNLLPMN